MLKTSADILTLPSWAIFFHPPDPPIALQSFTRDAPFSLVAMASNINDPSKLARSPSGAGLIGLLLRAWTSTDLEIFPSLLVSPSQEQPGLVQTCARTLILSPRVGRLEPPATCERCTAPLLRSSLGDGETPCLKVRSDEVQNGSSWRSQAAAAPCGFTSR